VVGVVCGSVTTFPCHASQLCLAVMAGDHGQPTTVGSTSDGACMRCVVCVCAVCVRCVQSFLSTFHACCEGATKLVLSYPSLVGLSIPAAPI
jgi:hypothetical protein